MSKVLGYTYGSFVTKDAEHKKISYAKIYVSEELKQNDNPDIVSVGEKAIAYPCIDASVLKGVVVGDYVNLFFDGRNRVAMIQQMK